MTQQQQIEVKRIVLNALDRYNKEYFTHPQVHEIVEEATDKITAIVEEK